MNQGFKTKFEQMRDGNPVSNEQAESENDSYFSHSNVRTIQFQWPDGRKLFLNYSYLVSGEYDPKQHTITLVFTSTNIVLKGVKLNLLFEELVIQKVRQVVCIDPRYAQVQNEGQAVVNEIVVG